MALINDGPDEIDGRSDDEDGEPASVALRHEVRRQRSAHDAGNRGLKLEHKFLMLGKTFTLMH